MQELPISSFRFVAMDTETTGAKPGVDDPCEWAAWCFDEDFDHHRFQSLVMPEVAMTPGARQVHGISDEMLEGAPGLGDVTSRFQQFLQACGRPRLLLAHNAGFDVGILHGAWARQLGRSSSGSTSSEEVEWVLDTCMMAKALLPELKTHKLSALAEHFQVPAPPAYHRAMADVVVLRHVFMALLGVFAEKAARRGEDLTLGVLLDVVGGSYRLSFSDRQIWKDPFVLSSKAQQIADMVGSKQVLAIVYDHEDDDRYISPLAVRMKSFYVYIDAFCHRDQVKKTFRADRIRRWRIPAPGVVGDDSGF